MRLIKYNDADKVIKDYWKEQVDNLPKHMDFDSLSDECKKILKHNSNILEALHDIKPVEAIPIEWIEEYSYDLDSEHETISACAIDDMLGAWRKEQSDEAD